MSHPPSSLNETLAVLQYLTRERQFEQSKKLAFTAIRSLGPDIELLTLLRLVTDEPKHVASIEKRLSDYRRYLMKHSKSGVNASTLLSEDKLAQYTDALDQFRQIIRAGQYEQAYSLAKLLYSQYGSDFELLTLIKVVVTDPNVIKKATLKLDEIRNFLKQSPSDPTVPNEPKFGASSFKEPPQLPTVNPTAEQPKNLLHAEPASQQPSQKAHTEDKTTYSLGGEAQTGAVAKEIGNVIGNTIGFVIISASVGGNLGAGLGFVFVILVALLIIGFAFHLLQNVILAIVGAGIALVMLTPLFAFLMSFGFIFIGIGYVLGGISGLFIGIGRSVAMVIAYTLARPFYELVVNVMSGLTATGVYHLVFDPWFQRNSTSFIRVVLYGVCFGYGLFLSNAAFVGVKLTPEERAKLAREEAEALAARGGKPGFTLVRAYSKTIKKIDEIDEGGNKVVIVREPSFLETLQIDPKSLERDQRRIKMQTEQRKMNNALQKIQKNMKS